MVKPTSNNSTENPTAAQILEDRQKYEKYAAEVLAQVLRLLLGEQNVNQDEPQQNDVAPQNAESLASPAENTNSISASKNLSSHQRESLKDYVTENYPGKNTGKIVAYIFKYSDTYNIDPCLALAIAEQESGFKQNVGSRVGASGVFQLMPATAKGLKVNRKDMAQNIKGGIKLLSQFINKYDGDLSKAAAAYNWGPGFVDAAIAKYGENWIEGAKSGGIKWKGKQKYMPNETYKYISSIAQKMDKYRDVAENPSESTKDPTQTIAMNNMRIRNGGRNS